MKKDKKIEKTQEIKKVDVTVFFLYQIIDFTLHILHIPTPVFTPIHILTFTPTQPVF